MAKSKNKLRHVAIIMDGNGRWAKERNLSRLEGHKKGAEAVETALKTALELELEYLTLYAFSTENWSRSEEEVNGLMALLEEFIDDKLDSLQEKNIRLKVIGRIAELPTSTSNKIKIAVEKTAKNSAGTLVLAINYGGRAELADAAKRISEDVKKGIIANSDIDEALVGSYLYDPEIPDPDLMIRTSGEVRLSNFLLWELAYSEFYFTEVLWPDFGREEFLQAADKYYGRERRFGGRL